MKKQTYLCEIVYKEEIAADTIDMRIRSKEIAKDAKPGQFLNVRCCERLSVLLRRPISICDVEPSKEEVRLIFQIKGDGTKLLASKNLGDQIDVLGPLGNGFTTELAYSNPLIVGGGIGSFPLLMLAKNISSKKPKVYLGFRSKDFVVLENDFQPYCREVKIATDDGSYGYHGYVTEFVEDSLKNKNNDIVYACGPEPMLKSIQEICNLYNVPCQLSLEQRMGCGIGACLVCACKIKCANEWEYKHICKDGPVFWGREIIFDD